MATAPFDSGPQNKQEAENLVTLLIKHLPDAIPQDTLSRIFSHYGASSVRPCSAGRLRNCVFVDFGNEPLASQAQMQLNGYAYPPVDGNILTNIVNALIAVPRFYTQVLHLMNKMNIPAPFRMALPTPPLPPPVPTASAPQPPPLPPSVPVQPTPPPTADLSSSESEMDSDEDNDKGNSFGNSEVAKPGRKRVRRESIVGPAINKDVAHEAVGVKPATLTRKEIPVIKKKNPVLQIKITPKASQTEDKDDSVAKELEEPNKEDSDVKPFATPEELEMGKLPPEEILSLPMFKEGRMRGQAFVTFPSVELAHRALNLVNGYVFKGKPMIIQFGRNPAAAKPN